MLQKLPESIGEALHNQRAGLERSAFYRMPKTIDVLQITVRSSAFDSEKSLAVKYTADGAGISPPLEWNGVPETAASVVVLVEDADSPTPSPLVHAIVVNLDPQQRFLSEAALNSPDHEGIGLQAGRNSYLMHAWLPPDPPPGHGPHRYVFQVFALGDGASFSAAPGRHEVFRAIEEHVVGAGYAIGIYERLQRIPIEESEEETAEETADESLVMGAPA
jgi:Raf kinase inhibitor-like YbhB/YbcL family protein